MHARKAVSVDSPVACIDPWSQAKSVVVVVFVIVVVVVFVVVAAAVIVVVATAVVVVVGLTKVHAREADSVAFV